MIEINTSAKATDKEFDVENIRKAAIYVRTARRDDGKEESDSVTDQKVLLQEFVGNEPNIEIYDIYVDDGWSGTNFNRPGFQRMMNDIKEKNVDCVIVKDISRFGRNYIESGRYLEEIFPFMDIRFISVNDNLDSVKNPQTISNLLHPFANLLYEGYCRDISNKVRSSLDMKRKQGKYIGSFPPFGYKKDPDDYNHLVIDEEAASVVREIFSWSLAGMSILSISKRLNEMGVSNPTDYKKQHGAHYHNPSLRKSNGEWSDSSVRRLLKNRMYVGDMVQGVTRVKSYKEQIVIRQYPEDWIIAENAHEAIISREDFEIVQKLFRNKGEAL